MESAFEKVTPKSTAAPNLISLGKKEGRVSRKEGHLDVRRFPREVFPVLP